jgi:hypothetical protein
MKQRKQRNSAKETSQRRIKQTRVGLSVARFFIISIAFVEKSVLLISWYPSSNMSSARPVQQKQRVVKTIKRGTNVKFHIRPEGF